jgi:hypothetical protein
LGVLVLKGQLAHKEMMDRLAQQASVEVPVYRDNVVLLEQEQLAQTEQLDRPVLQVLLGLLD